ncbi:AAA family ATPase [Nakamurella sp.]|uniref:AAA family ATPase n=1 Tax=Nakamurella sp. TaxID=1869182 RepID=UPI003B3B5EC6
MTAEVTLSDRLHAVRAALARQLDEPAPPPRPPTGRDGLAGLVGRCGLTPFERDVLVLAAGVELDDELARLSGRVLGDPAWTWASFGLALRVLPEPHWDAITPDRPLRGLALLHPDPRAGGLTLARLRVDPRVLLALLGLDSGDEQLAEFALVLTPDPGLLPAGQARQLDRLAAEWTAGDARPLLLRGPADAREAFVRALADRIGSSRVWQLAATALPADVAELTALVRRAARETRFGGSPFVLTLDDADPGQLGAARRLAHRLASAGPRIVVSGPDPVAGLPASARMLDLLDADPAEQLAVWRRALGPAAAGLNGHVERLAGQFRLPADHLRAVAGEIAGTVRERPPAEVADELWHSCRIRTRADLDGLAERIVPDARWHDLVLPDRELAALRDLLRHARHRSTVFETWRVAGGSRRGAGVTALFTGPSGTGKSLAAEVIAAELDIDLYRVDLSQVISKYIGETEKNLRKVFDAAEHSGAVLVIDEADALFGQRSQVKDSHDRYANVEISYLLQRMESYRGLAVLTTNLRSNIDQAFVRRLAFIIAFPFPDLAARRRLWQSAFGPRVPVAALDADRLAQLTLAGGSIRNVAVHAAFLAAERGDAVTMADLLRGAHSEYAKLERSPTPSELAGWPG